jgi:hypothetical protein
MVLLNSCRVPISKEEKKRMKKKRKFTLPLPVFPTDLSTPFAFFSLVQLSKLLLCCRTVKETVSYQVLSHKDHMFQKYRTFSAHKTGQIPEKKNLTPWKEMVGNS